LQAYALLEKLKRLHHDPELLLVQTTPFSTKLKIKYYLKKYIVPILPRKYQYISYTDKIEQNTNHFIKHYITPKTPPVYKSEHFSKITEKNYDAYIIGSDQVWRAKVYRYIDYAFFGFVKSKKPILMSYAASFGVDSWDFTEEQTERYGNQLSRFKGISVREDSGVELCKRYFNQTAIQVLDPTMLLKPEDYMSLAQRENEPDHDGRLLTYILDNNVDKQSVVKTVEDYLGLRPFSVNIQTKDGTNKIEDMIYPTVTSWLKGFDNAEFVITDSFHGCVFAILFNKPFIAYGNISRGMARFTSLLKMFGLESRLAVCKEDISSELINEKIDWSSVNIKLDEYRKISIDYLVNTLSKNTN
jgi:hypothetical protein